MRLVLKLVLVLLQVPELRRLRLPLPEQLLALALFWRGPLRQLRRARQATPQGPQPSRARQLLQAAVKLSAPALQAGYLRPQRLRQVLPVQRQAASIPIAQDSVAAPAVAAHCVVQRVFPAGPAPTQIMRR